MRRALMAVLFLMTTLVAVALPLPPSAVLGPEPAFAQTAGFVGVVPARLLDTREGVGAPRAAVPPGGRVNLQVTGRGGVPASGVSAVVLNVTVTQPTATGYVTVYPTNEPQPVASNLNFVPGQTVPNLVIVKLGNAGQVTLFNSAGATHLLADVSGYYTTGSQFVPTSPSRLIDTRNATGGVTGPTNGTVDVQVIGRAGVPAGATSVVMNVTVTEPTSSGYLTVWPKGGNVPRASNLNYSTGQTVPNLVISRIGAEGRISYFNNAGRVHVIMDVLGYITSPTSMTEVLDAVSSSGSWREGTVTLNGSGRLNSVYNDDPQCDRSNPGWVEYNLGRSWGTLATTMGFSDIRGEAGTSVRFRILGDGAVLDDRTLSFGQSADVSVNVTNVLRIRFEIYNATPTGAVFCPDGIAFMTPRLLTVPGSGFPAPAEYTALVPERILDTREGIGAGRARVEAGGVIDLEVVGRGGVPATGVSAVVMNVTVTEPDASSYLTVWPSGAARPLASNLNFLPGQTVPNLVIAPVGSNGRVSLFNAAGRTHVIADVLGWFPGSVDARPTNTELAAYLDAVSSTGSWREGTVTLNGAGQLNSVYQDDPQCERSNPGWVEYNLGRGWTTLTTTVGFSDIRGRTGTSARFRILGDGRVLDERTLSFGQSANVSVNVANVLRLRLEILNTSPTGATSCPDGIAFMTPRISR